MGTNIMIVIGLLASWRGLVGMSYLTQSINHQAQDTFNHQGGAQFSWIMGNKDGLEGSQDWTSLTLH